MISDVKRWPPHLTPIGVGGLYGGALHVNFPFLPVRSWEAKLRACASV